MANRHKNFNELLASEFTDLEFSQAFIIELMRDEDLSVEEALRKTIVAMGLKSFADKSGLTVQRVSDFVAGRRRFKIETIDEILRQVFNLKIKITLERAA